MPINTLRERNLPNAFLNKKRKKSERKKSKKNVRSKKENSSRDLKKKILKKQKFLNMLLT